MDKEMTEDELVAALLQAADTNEVAKGALTTRALVKIVGRSKLWVRERIRELKEEGLVESVRIQTVDVADRVTTSPAYRLKKSTTPR